MSLVERVAPKMIELARKAIIKGPVKLTDVCGFEQQLAERQVKAQLPEVLFLGNTNVGKSSLLSKFLSPYGAPKPSSAKPRDLPNVSKKMGFTTTLNFYTINNYMRLVDSPGYGYKSNIGHGKIVTDYLDNHSTSLRHAYILLDPIKGVGSFDQAVAQLLVGKGIPFDVVLTKCDKLTKHKRDFDMQRILDQIHALGGIVQYVFQTSTEDEKGVDLLRGAVWKSMQYSTLRDALKKERSKGQQSQPQD